MTLKIGINGWGRIGRMVIRSIIESKNKNIEIKHINNRSNSEISCSLLKYDSVHGKFNAEVKFNNNSLTIKKKKKYHFHKNQILIILSGKNLVSIMFLNALVNLILKKNY